MSLPVPYYEDESVTLFCGDALEVLPYLSRNAACVTDPQYGIGFKVNVKRERSSGLDFGKHSIAADRDPDWLPLQNDDRTPFDPAPLLDFQELILWGANNYAAKLPSKRGWLIWDKLGDKRPCDFGDCELAWTNLAMPTRIWRQLWRGLVRAGEDNVANGPKLHPCQKPIELMRWCIGFTSAETIVDPYAGSGTTLRAAKDLGRRAIGIEIEERYCETIVRRLAQGVLPFTTEVA